MSHKLGLRGIALITALLSGLALVSQAGAEQEPLISRDALFGNPDKAQGRVSPDGRYLSFLAPRDGVLNVWVAPAGDFAAARPITQDANRGIRQHFWAYDGKTVLYLQDEGGDENWRLHAVDVTSAKDRDLTPLAGIQTQMIDLSPAKPDTVLVGLNDRSPEWHDVYAISLATGERKLVEQNDQQIAAYYADRNLGLRMALRTLPEGGEILRRSEDGWVRVLAYGQEDSLNTQPLAVSSDGKSALVYSSVGRDKTALERINLSTGERTVVAASARSDISDVWLDPQTREPLAWADNYLQTQYYALTPAIGKDIEKLSAALGSFAVTSRALDMQSWTVVTDAPDDPSSTYLYERKSGKVSRLFDARPALAGAPLVTMHPLKLNTRDGLAMVSYLSLPRGSDPDGDSRPAQPLPMVLLVHGGPWSRDEFGYDSLHQWLVNRGYAVLSVNYRGSTGFGKAFVNAGDREWAAKMHDDLIDAVNWAIEQKVTSPKQVAIMGGSYGGYATLVGLTFTPEIFACGVDIVGPSNLITLLESVPAYWKSFFEDLARRVGDPRTEGGRKLLKERSPLTRVDAIKRPLLIGQGANDPRVKQAESDQIVSAMEAKGLPVTYVLYPDEGHGFARPQNRLAFFAISEAFLSKCLGGRFEPIGNGFAGSSITVPAGAQHVPGLQQALSAD